jgi:hypothetical protein
MIPRILTVVSVVVTAIALAGWPSTAAAQLSAGGRTIGGGGVFKVDCSVAVGEDTIFQNTSPVKSLCATVQADANCPLMLRVKDSIGNELASAYVNYNNTVTRCATNASQITLQRAAPGGLASVNWRADSGNNK